MEHQIVSPFSFVDHTNSQSCPSLVPFNPLGSDTLTLPKVDPANERERLETWSFELLKLKDPETLPEAPFSCTPEKLLIEPANAGRDRTRTSTAQTLASPRYRLITLLLFLRYTSTAHANLHPSWALSRLIILATCCKPL